MRCRRRRRVTPRQGQGLCGADAIETWREAVNTKFGRKAMYRVVLDHDPEIQDALKMIDKNPTLKDLFRYAEQEKSLKKAAVTR